MRYVRIYADDRGRTAFQDVETQPEARTIAIGVPPLLVSGPFPAASVIFVEQKANTPDWLPHPAPQRQWVVVVRGRASITVSTGESREFGPGEPILLEDTAGEGHISTPLTSDFAFMMIPVGD